jgi:hypothetical protein
MGRWRETVELSSSSVDRSFQTDTQASLRVLRTAPQAAPQVELWRLDREGGLDGPVA